MASVNHPSLHQSRPSQSELLTDATLTPYEMSDMNKARANFKELERFIHTAIIPAVGGYRSDLGEQLEALLCNVRDLSGQFCWKHRHLGAMHSAQEVPHGKH